MQPMRYGSFVRFCSFFLLSAKSEFSANQQHPHRCSCIPLFNEKSYIVCYTTYFAAHFSVYNATTHCCNHFWPEGMAPADGNQLRILFCILCFHGLRVQMCSHAD
ncbi:MAG: hypothetical protein J3Q66DRAFT_348919 [Benniella sp.]|nr:MAG: hypothetical protein J3Q66DRAFT_348919 [Benniella sp.]